MRIIYMGTPEFAVPGLKALVDNGFNVVAVITAPDKPQGRGLQTGQTPVKEYAVSVGLKVLQPEKLKDENFLAELKALQADLQIVVAFRMLPEVVWNMPPLGTFNLHASLLPQYRGAAPINWAIINGEKETGITTFFLKHEIDTGDVILQEREPILDTDNVGTLYERLMYKGADLILETVRQIQAKSINQKPQVFDSELKSAPKIFKEHCEINWSLKGEQIRNFVRGLSPYPSAFTYINGVYCKVFEVEYSSEILPLSQILTDGKSYVRVGVVDGSISIVTLQLEGKKKMLIKDFLLGNKVNSIGVKNG